MEVGFGRSFRRSETYSKRNQVHIWVFLPPSLPVADEWGAGQGCETREKKRHWKIRNGFATVWRTGLWPKNDPFLPTISAETRISKGTNRLGRPTFCGLFITCKQDPPSGEKKVKEKGPSAFSKRWINGVTCNRSDWMPLTSPLTRQNGLDSLKERTCGMFLQCIHYCSTSCVFAQFHRHQPIVLLLSLLPSSSIHCSP